MRRRRKNRKDWEEFVTKHLPELPCKVTISGKTYSAQFHLPDNALVWANGEKDLLTFKAPTLCEAAEKARASLLKIRAAGRALSKALR